MMEPTPAPTNDRVLDPGARATPEPLTLDLPTGSEGVVRLVAVPITELDLYAAAPRYDKHRMFVKLAGTTNLPDETKCAVTGVFRQDAPAVGGRSGVAYIEAPTRIDLGEVKLECHDRSGSLELTIDLFKTRLFYDGKLSFEVRPSYPCSPAFKVRGEIYLRHAVSLVYSEMGSEMIGATFQAQPRIPTGFESWCTIRLCLCKQKRSGDANKQADDREAAGDSVVWNTDSGFGAKVLRLGCAPVDGPPVLLYPGVRSRAEGDAAGAADGSHVCFVHRLYVETKDPDPEKLGSFPRCAILEREFCVPWPEIQDFHLAYVDKDLEPVAGASATSRYVIAQGAIAGLAQDLNLYLEISLWTTHPLPRGQIVLIDQVSPIREVVVTDGSFPRSVLVDFDSPEAVDRKYLRESSPFLVARVPSALTNSNHHPFANVIQYPEQTYRPLVDGELFLEALDSAAQKLRDRTGKTDKQLASSIASAGAFTADARIARLPAFHKIFFEVRGEQLYVRCPLAGPPEYWKEAETTVSVSTGEGAQLKPAGTITKTTPPVFEAPIALSSVYGKVLVAKVSAQKAPAKWRGQEIPKPENAVSTRFECKPTLVGVEWRLVDGAILVECETHCFPTQPTDKTLLVEVLKITESGEPQLVSGVTLTYKLAVGAEGVCGANGKLVATLSAAGAQRLHAGRYKFRVRRAQGGGTIHHVAVEPVVSLTEWAKS